MESVKVSKVIPFERLACLEKFYVGKVGNAAVITEDLKAAGSMSDDLKGQWVLDQFLKAARTLNVDEFVIPVGAFEGMEIPEIPTLADYETAFQDQRRELMEGLELTIPMKKRAETTSRKATEDLENLVKSLEESTFPMATRQEEEESEEGNSEERLEKARKILDQKYQKWLTLHTGLQKDLQSIADWKLEATKSAIKQRDADVDAKQGLINALAVLKKFLAGLMNKVPIVEAVVRQMTGESLDPYEISDKDLGLRACFQNLQDRFRKNDSLGIATSIMIGMRETQNQTEPLSWFVRRVETFHHEMVGMGVTTIALSDLAAMIAISGMKESHRKEFLQAETTLALTLDNMVEEPEDPLDIEGKPVKSSGTVASRTGRRRNLYEKVIAFSRKEEESKILLGKFSSQVKNDPSKAEAAKKVKEAQLAFATEVTRRDPGVCFSYARDGNCKRGDSCPFKHSLGTSALKSPGICFGWRDTGECSFGKSCRFSHPPRETTPVTPVTVAPKAVAAAPKTPGTSNVKGTKKQIPGSAAARILFALGKGDPESDAESETSCVVLVKKPTPTVCAATEVSEKPVLGWDTMASLNVAKNLDVIPGARALKKVREAVGVGGARPITHTGKSEIFRDLEMSYIEGGETPNLMSIGRVLQKDREGRPGVAIFSERGAVRFRVTPAMMKRVAALVDHAAAEDLVEGEAIMRNYVYEEEYPGGSEGGTIEDATDESAYAVSHSMFGSRVRLGSVDQVLSFMVEAGLNQEAIIKGLEGQSLRGLPSVISVEAVNAYFKHIGKTSEQLEAEICRARLSHPIDHEADAALAPGSIMQIDNIDPSFSRMKVDEPEDRASSSIEGVVRKATKTVVSSVGGYKDAVIAVDECTGYGHLIGRVNKKDPHKVLGAFINKWRGRWGSLTFIKADKEFVTPEAIDLVQSFGGRIRQAVPGDHRRTTGMVEGVIRWITEGAQANMNRLRIWVKDKVISPHQHRTLWYHALRSAVFAYNFRPSLHNPKTTRYEEGTGDIANLSNVVMMPFGMRVMGKNLINAEDGRGSECLYIGPSSTVRGGILTYSLATGRVSVKYAFLPLNNVRRPTEAVVRTVSRQMYGTLGQAPEQPPHHSGSIPGWEEVAGFGHLVDSQQCSLTGQSLIVPGDNLSGTGQSLIEPGDNLSGKGKSLIEPGDNFSGTGQSLIEPGDNLSGTGQSLTEPGDNLSGTGEGDILSERRSSLIGPGNILSGTRDSVIEPGDNLSGTGEGVIAPGTNLPRQSGEDVNQSTSGIMESIIPGQGDLRPLAQSPKSGGGGTAHLAKAGKRAPVVSNYGTRNKSKASVAVVSYDVMESEGGAMVPQTPQVRPLKPRPPSSKVCNNCPLWIAAEEREVTKLKEEDTFIALPRNEYGIPTRPKDAMVLRLIRIREYKWKPDPETGVERWLECIRLVCDGSVDKRPQNYYAETPDRTLLFLMSSIEATMGIHATGSDVTRAYLNALSIDRNIVVVAPKGLRGLPKESLLNKGLYGSRAGALSWQVWIDEVMGGDLGYQKLDVCRGVYAKRLESGHLLKAYRHSDDFRMSSADTAGRVLEENKLRGQVRMAEFTKLDRFLGCTFEWVNAKTGSLDPHGTVLLVRQVDKIKEMETDFADLRIRFNPRGRARKTPVPPDAIKEDSELDSELGRALSPDEVALYQSVVGCVNWVINSTRPDAMLGGFLLATRMSKPRVWDLKMAAHMVDYLVHTVDAPLVLGGSILEPEIYADASFASLPERRSIMGHLAITGRGSGAIYAQVGSTKTAVNSIWEAELMAGCRGMDTALYITQACRELEYPIGDTRTVRVDNQAEVDWINGSVSNKRSRHIDVRYYRSRHLQEEGSVSVQYIPTEENIADILTKPLSVRVFRKHAVQILGHGLVQGLGITGIFEELEECEDN